MKKGGVSDLSLMEDATTESTAAATSAPWKFTKMAAVKAGYAQMVRGSVHGSGRRHAAIASALKIARHWRVSIGLAFFDQGRKSFADFAQLAITARLMLLDECSIHRAPLTTMLRRELVAFIFALAFVTKQGIAAGGTS